MTQLGLGERSNDWNVKMILHVRFSLKRPVIFRKLSTSGPMECGLTNPARAGRQQRQFALRLPWSP